MPAESNSPVSGQPMRDRAMHVFVSSAFRDVLEERDHLVTDVFPDLRERVEPARQSEMNGVEESVS